MQISHLLKTTEIGQNLHFFATVDSTNRIAKELAEQQIPSGFIVAADQQTNGQGRQGRVWHSPAGKNLYFSIVIDPKKETKFVPQLALVAGLAVAQTIQPLLDENNQVGIKWPNDVWINKQKCCGILCEFINATSANPRLVIGIGININIEQTEIPPELSNIATSLKIVTQQEHDRAEILAKILNKFEENLHLWQAQGLQQLTKELNKYSVLQNKQVTISTPASDINGKVINITEEGNLLIQQYDNSCIAIAAGEVHITKID